MNGKIDVRGEDRASCSGPGPGTTRQVRATRSQEAHTQTALGGGILTYPHYVGGEWECPPEDCGGIPGYYRMLDALADPEHPDHAEAAEYLLGYAPEEDGDLEEDGDPKAIDFKEIDLKEIDELPLRIALGRIANRRNAPRTKIAKEIT